MMQNDIMKSKSLYEVGEYYKEFNKNNVTATCFRIEKLDYVVPEKKLHPFYDVYEFYTVNNGFKYIRHHEESVNEDNTKRQLGAIYKDIRLGYNNKAKEEGNNLYKKFKNKGYKLIGIYETDICGYARRIK